MDSAKNQLVEKLQAANNILVTVTRNPSVDQLAACIGLTLLLNKLDKHATAVFSGAVPSTIEFLQPEDTLEKNTDSLRDFIIALDKSKADKLRYKVEDEMVRIFITPYRTSINQDDLEFSEGDFNVDLVVALGVSRQEDLDQAIVAHGRILHDATVSTINVVPGGSEEGLGSINWSDPQASSLSELVADLARALGQNLLDGQLATALLTGIVAETDRFSNEKTSSQTMTVSAELMAAGANQQLVATKLDEAEAQFKVRPGPDKGDANQTAALNPPEPPKSDDGTLEIEHDDESDKLDELAKNGDEPAPLPSEPVQPAPPPPSQADIIANELEAAGLPATTLPAPVEIPSELPHVGPARALDFSAEQHPDDAQNDPATEPVAHTAPNPITANSQPDDELETVNDPLSLPPVQESPSQPQMNSQTAAPVQPAATAPSPTPAPSTVMTGFTPPPPAWVPPSNDTLDLLDTAPPQPPVNIIPPTAPAPGNSQSDDGDTLTEIEQAVNSPHLPAADVDSARDQVSRALNSTESSSPALSPIEALNAQPLGGDLHPQDNPPVPAQSASSFADTLQQAIPQVPVNLPGLTTTQVITPDPGNVVSPFPSDQVIPQTSEPSQVSHSFAQPQPFVAPPQEPAPAALDPNAPPPVPPPIPFRFGNTTEPPRQ